MNRAFRRLRIWLSGIRGQDGQGMTEYGLILVLVSIIAIVVVTIIGHQTNNEFSNISNGLAH